MAHPSSDGVPAMGVDRELDFLVTLSGPSLVEIQTAQAARPSASGSTALTTAAMRTVRESMVRRQRTVAQAVDAGGMRVVASFQAAANGLHVVARPDQVPLLLRIPGVTSVARIPALETNLSRTAPHIGATRLVQELGYDGSETIVAVVDSGIDYTHTAFGGSGSPDEYITNDPEFVEPGTFPTVKVVGGFDFAGELYHADCPEADELAGLCSRTPAPDDDPLDGLAGHGTHVADVVAGEGPEGMAPGVAPGAHLVALKVLGNPAGYVASTVIWSQAVEWATEHNLGMAVDGTAPPGKIDVMNLSLSSAWSGRMEVLEQLVSAAAGAGITVVAAAGNDGNIPFVLGSPAAAEAALAVGGTVSPGVTAPLLQASWFENGNPQRLEPAPIFEEGGTHIDGRWMPSLAETGAITATLAWYGLACPNAQGEPTPPTQNVTDKVALVERGDCSFYAKMQSAQQMGAVAVVMFTDLRRRTGMGCTGPECTNALAIPGVMIDRDPGLLLKQLVVDGAATVTVVIDADDVADMTDSAMMVSSRGPSRYHAGVKPQVMAPGVGIEAANASSLLSRTIPYSGTSMAAAHAAGVASLLWNRNRAENLGLDALDIAALVVNYAQPTVKLEDPATGRIAAVARQGAGLVNAWRSAEGGAVVRSEHGLAELSFGIQHLTDEPAVVERTLRVRNLDGSVGRYAATARFAQDGGGSKPGVSFEFEPQPLGVAVDDTAELTVRVTLEPDSIRPWALGDEMTIADESRFRAHEADGWIELVEVDEQGQPIEGGDAIVVPFHIMPKRLSCIASESTDAFRLVSTGSTASHVWRNDCGQPGKVQVFHLLGVDPAESEAADDFPAVVDVTAIGVRTGRTGGSATGAVEMIEWAVRMADGHRIPTEALIVVYIDRDVDGAWDVAVLSYPEYIAGSDEYTGRWLVGHAPVTSGLQVDRSRLTLSTLMGFDLEQSVARLAVPVEELGLDVSTGQIAFGVAVVSGTEDFPLTATYLGFDFAPDGLATGGYVHDWSLAGCLTVSENGRRLDRVGGVASVPGDGLLEATLGVAEACLVPDSPAEVGLLFDYAGNRTGPSQAEIRSGTLGGAEPEFMVFMPYAALNHATAAAP